MTEIRSLGGNEWVELRVSHHPELCPTGYTYAHEVKGNGNKIAIMPFRLTGDENIPVEWLLLDEVTLCWEGEDAHPHSITGTVDEGNTPLKTAKIELHEEAGFDVSEEDLIALGTCYGSKAMDTVYHLYTVDLTNVNMGEAITDGHPLEEAAQAFWAVDVSRSSDPMSYVIHFRAFAHLIESKTI